jgi:hypothetical protein
VQSHVVSNRTKPKGTKAQKHASANGNRLRAS